MDKWEHVHHDVQSLIDHRLAVAEDGDMTLDLAGTALDCIPSAVDPFSIIVATLVLFNWDSLSTWLAFCSLNFDCGW